jgi:hypothetical protein
MVGQLLEAARFRLLDLYSAEAPSEPKPAFDRDL